MGMNKEGTIRITNYQTNFGTSGGLVVGNRRLMTLSPRFSYLETFWVEPTVEDVFFKRQVQEAQTMKKNSLSGAISAKQAQVRKARGTNYPEHRGSVRASHPAIPVLILLTACNKLIPK